MKYQMKSVSVIIVTHNGMPWIDRIFSSIEQQIIKPRLVIIDNASSDTTVEYIKKQHGESIIVPLPSNIGFGRANNIGMRIARKQGADLFFLLNQDAWFAPNSLDLLLSIQGRHSEFGIIAPLQIRPNSLTLDPLFEAYSYKPILETLELDKRANRLREVYESSFANAAAWLLSRKCLEKTGGFDPLFFMYGEDSDYVTRARFHGFKIGICPQASVYHDREDRPFLLKEYEQRSVGLAICQVKNPFDNIYLSFIKLCFKEMLRSAKYFCVGQYRRGYLPWRRIFYLAVNFLVIRDSYQESRRLGAFL